MRKILFPLRDSGFSISAFNFMKRLNSTDPILATGIHIPELSNDPGWSAISEPDVFSLPRLLEEDETMVRTGAHEFMEACKKEHISCRIPEAAGSSGLDNIRRETRFADLLILGFEAWYQRAGTGPVYRYIQKGLEYAECPVLLVPGESSFPENIIISYDGSASSVYAIKMFGYLFDLFRDSRITIIYAGADKDDLPLQGRIKELVECHFTDTRFQLLGLKGGEEFASWLEDQPNPLLVTGSYGRSELSRFFRESFAAKVIEDHRVPVFITHK